MRLLTYTSARAGLRTGPTVVTLTLIPLALAALALTSRTLTAVAWAEVTRTRRARRI